MTEQEHKHEWFCAEQSSNDKIICGKCGVDYDEWVAKMMAKGYTYKQLERFEIQ